MSLFDLNQAWPVTAGAALGGLGALVLISPITDRLATWLVRTPPDLGVFRGLQESPGKLVAGIVLAWILGGFLEELVLRGLVVHALHARLAVWLPDLVAGAVAIVAAGGLALAIHLYQGLRAALIVAQLSLLLGVLFVVSGEDLWTVVLCHGLYDTIAFIRFARRSSAYANVD